MCLSDEETGEEESAEVAMATNNSNNNDEPGGGGKRSANGKSSRSQEALSSFVKAQVGRQTDRQPGPTIGLLQPAPVKVLVGHSAAGPTG